MSLTESFKSNEISSPLLDDNTATYVIIYMIHCPESGVLGSPDYAICQTEIDARRTYADKLKLVIEMAGKEDEKGIYGEDGEQYFYYYWCCLLKVSAKLQSGKDFADFVESYRSERDERSDDGDDEFVFDAYNEIFRSFVIKEKSSDDRADENILDEYLLDIWL